MEISPLTAPLGARITGIDLAEPLDAQTVSEIKGPAGSPGRCCWSTVRAGVPFCLPAG